MKPILLFLTVGLLLSACCDSKYLGEILLSQDQKVVNPYVAADSIVFTDENNDSIVFFVQWRKVELNHLEDGGCADCCADFCNAETDQTWITADGISSSFGILLYFPYPFDPWPNKEPAVSFNFARSNSTGNPVNVSFPELPINALDSFAAAEGFLRDTLILGTKSFVHVLALPGYCYYTDSLYCDTLYYNVSEGVVGFRMSDGNLLVKQ